MYIRRVGKRYTLKVVPDIYKYYCVYSHTLYIYIYMYFFFSLQENGAKGMDGLCSGCILPLRVSYTAGYDSYTTSSVADINDVDGGRRSNCERE